MKHLIVLILLFIMACSTGEERRDVVEKTCPGKIIYQHNPKVGVDNDFFVIKHENGDLRIFFISAQGNIKNAILIKNDEIKAEVEEIE